jgi:hypothetical protein
MVYRRHPYEVGGKKKRKKEGFWMRKKKWSKMHIQWAFTQYH